MELTEENIREIVRINLQPFIRVDGGDIEFEKFDSDNIIHLGAHAECAICPASPDRLKWWVEKEFKKAFNRECQIIIKNRIPYFEQ
ncbi:MAG: NifU family protein [Spirochaetaceae bacterium]